MKTLSEFNRIYETACQRKGGERSLKLRFAKQAKDSQVKKLGDDRFLAEFSKKVFQSGFVWRVVEQKWHNFERIFHEFSIGDVLMMPDEMLEEIAQDPSIIRHYTKVKSIKENAYMIHEVRQDHESFAKFIADWPSDDIVGLWTYLKKNGSRLGGNTGPYALRNLGKDTFLMTNDVEKYLRESNVFDGGASSQRSLKQVQNFFNELQSESGWSLSHLSQLIAYSTGDNDR